MVAARGHRGGTAALMDFFANQDAWAAAGNNNSNIGDNNNKSSNKKTIDQYTLNSDMTAIAMLGGGTVFDKFGRAGGLATAIGLAQAAFPGNPWLDAAGGAATAYGGAVWSAGLMGAGSEMAGVGFGTALSMQAGGAYIVSGTGLMLGGGTLIVFGVGAMGVTAYGGYKLGTVISNIPTNKSGGTVSSSIADWLYPPSPGMLILAPTLPLHSRMLR